MNLVRLMCVEKDEFTNALGDDRILVVRGTRNGYQNIQSVQGKLSSSIFEGKLFGHEVCECNDDEDVPIGGAQTTLAHRNRTRNRGTQTRRLEMSLNSKGEFRFKLKVLTAYPIDILKDWKGTIEQPSQQANRVSIGLQTKNQNVLMNRQNKINVSSLKSGMRRLSKSIKSIFTAELISMDVSEDELSDFEEHSKKPKEKWLEFTSSDDELDHNVAASDRFLPVEPRSYQFHKEMWPLYFMMSVFGRYPFKNSIKNRLYHYTMPKSSILFIIFCFTTIITTGFTFLSLCNFLFVLAIRDKDKPLRYPEFAEHIEIEKYWPLVFYHLIFGIYVSAWSVSIILYDGRRISEYLSRMSYAVSAVRYQPFDSIKSRTFTTIAYIIIYTTTVVGIFITDWIPHIRGASGLFGTLIFRSYNSGLRISRHYYWIRILGLITHLYFVIAEKVITTFLSVNCKVLDNLATTWNLRMAHSLGMLDQFDENTRSSSIKYVSKIPYKKLLAEHNVILSFTKTVGVVFSGCFSLYLFMKAAETSVLGYRILIYLTVPSESESRYEDEYVTVTGGTYENPEDKVKYEDSFAISFLIIFVLLMISIVGWIWTILQFAQPGKTIKAGFGFVRRHGFLNCKSSKQTRFILSLNLHLGTNAKYDLNPGYLLNRKFITGTGIWQIFFIFGLLMFNPFKVGQFPLDICEPGPSGDIQCIRTYKVGLPPPENIHQQTYIPLRVVNITKGIENLNSTGKPVKPIEPFIILGTTMKPTFTTMLTTTKKPIRTTTSGRLLNYTQFDSDQSCINRIKNADYIQQDQNCEYKARWYVKDHSFSLPFPCEKGTNKIFVPNDASKYYFKKFDASLYSNYESCGISSSDLSDLDDCGNPPIITSSSNSKPTKRAVILFDFDLNFINFTPMIFCCYEYVGPKNQKSYSYKYCSSSANLVFNKVWDSQPLPKCKPSEVGKFYQNHFGNLLEAARGFDLQVELHKDVQMYLKPPTCPQNIQVYRTDQEIQALKKYFNITSDPNNTIRDLLKLGATQDEMDKCYC